MKCPGHARYSTATADINLFMVRLGCFRDIRYSTVLQRPRPRPALLAAMVCDATDALPFLLRIRGREAAISRPSDCRQPLHTVGRRCAMLPSYHDDLRGHWAPPACPVPFPKVAEIAGNSQSQVLSAAIGQSMPFISAPPSHTWEFACIPTAGRRGSHGKGVLGPCQLAVRGLCSETPESERTSQVRRPEKVTPPSKPRHVAHGTSLDLASRSCVREHSVCQTAVLLRKQC